MMMRSFASGVLLVISSLFSIVIVVDSFTPTSTHNVGTTKSLSSLRTTTTLPSSCNSNSRIHNLHHQQQQQHCDPSDRLVVLSATTNSDDVEKLREAAQKLRQDANDLKAELEALPKKSTVQQQVVEPPPSFTSLKDSTWTITYRFASEPESNENDKDEQEVQKRPFYSGKLQVTFLSDGYTKFISHDPTGSSVVEMEKIWGWDEELSDDNDEREEKNQLYILFSSTTVTPSNDAIHPNESLRFYWQGRVDKDAKDGTLSITDGTVTVKKNIEPPGGGFWGVFNGGGILAQFRYVGNFVAKPSRAME